MIKPVDSALLRSASCKDAENFLARVVSALLQLDLFSPHRILTGVSVGSTGHGRAGKFKPSTDAGRAGPWTS